MAHLGCVDQRGELTGGGSSVRVYVRGRCGPDHGGRERNPPRIPACGSPLDPVGDVHPGTRPIGPRVCRTNAGSLQNRSATRAADRPSRSNATPPRFTRCREPLGLAAAHRVTAGRDSPPNTAYPRTEAPMTAPAVAGASICSNPVESAIDAGLDADDRGFDRVAKPSGSRRDSACSCHCRRLRRIG